MSVAIAEKNFKVKGQRSKVKVTARTNAAEAYITTALRRG